jgi:hypothetical protein
MSEEKKKPAWLVVLEQVCPKIGRPRRMSIHTLAHCIGQDTTEGVLSLAKELQEAETTLGEKVWGYKCPDVKAAIFYLDKQRSRPGMIHTPNSLPPNYKTVWEFVPDFVKENPPEKIKGFLRFQPGGHWTGEKPGQGEFIKSTGNGTDKPFEKEDYPYAREIHKALATAGYKPGFEVPEECQDCDGH